MAGTLTPKFEPLRFQAECAPPGAPLFDPVVVSERALLVAGGPLAVGVFRVHERPRAWFTVKAQVWIGGFCVSAGSLYVQDGPVLSGWDLTSGECFGAANLSTDTFWLPGVDKDGEATSAPPSSFYKVADAEAARYAALMRARIVYAWAGLLELIEEQSPALDDAIRVQAAAFAERSRALLAGLGENAGKNTAENAGRQAISLATAQAGVAIAEAAASKTVYSAPVVRRLQEEGSAAGQIFSLALDGRIYSINDALTNITVSSFEPPWRAELMLAEPLDAVGNPGCYLYYVTADGGIREVDATPQPLMQKSRWAGKGAPKDADRVLPLRYRDGLLMGGGILGADFFVMPLDPAKGFMFTVPAPNQTRGWRDYEIEARDQLVLLSDGINRRMIAYGAGVKQRDRWGLRSGAAQSNAVFWPQPALDAAQPGPLLVLETDISGSGGTAKPEAAAAPSETGFSVVLANPVDSTNPALTGNYPPAPQTLDAGSFARWPAPPFPIAWLRGKPAIATQRLYCVVRSIPPQSQVAALFENNETGQAPVHLLQQMLQASAGVSISYGSGENDGSDAVRMFNASDMPRAAVNDAVAVFALIAEANAVRRQADAELARLRAMAQPIRVYVSRLDYCWWAKRTDGPHPFANVSLKMTFDQGPPIAGKTDARGMLEIDTTLAGRRMTLDVHVPPAYEKVHAVTIGSVTLELAKINVIEIKTSQQGPAPQSP